MSTHIEDQKHTIDIAFLMDTSGSMKDLSEVAVKAFNDFITDQKKVSYSNQEEVKITFITFNTETKVVYSRKDLSQVEELKEIVPDGNTSIYDAIGRCAEILGNYREVIMVIFTDGEENSSHVFSQSDITNFIQQKEKQDDGTFWSFKYLGPNKDSFLKVGLSQNSAISYNYSQNGCYDAIHSASSYVSVARQVSHERQSSGCPILSRPPVMIGRSATTEQKEPSSPSKLIRTTSGPIVRLPLLRSPNTLKPVVEDFVVDSH